MTTDTRPAAGRSRRASGTAVPATSDAATTAPASAGPPAAEQAKPKLPGRYEMLRTKDIHVNPLNVRDDATADSGIVANLKNDGPDGLVGPVIVITDPEGGYLLLDGERRYLSAVEAEQEWVQGIIRDDLAARSSQLITMLRSIHRLDPTGAQQARTIKQLVLDGMDLPTIAKESGFTADRVKAAAAAAGLDRKTLTTMHTQGLDLFQVGVVGEFADDPHAVKKLVAAGADGPFAFNRAVESARIDRRDRATIAAKRAELTKAGVRLLDRHPTYGDTDVARIEELQTRDGGPVTAHSHASCPGRAAFVGKRYDVDGKIAAVECCTDWRKNGHRRSGSRAGGPMTEDEKAARKLIVANNKAMEAANTARRAWLAETMFAAATPPKGAVRYIAEALTAHSAYFLEHWLRARRGLDTLLDPNQRRRTEGYLPARVSDARCTVVILAAIGAAHEERITRQSWRHPDDADARWLSFLVANGYQPGDVEQGIIDACNRPAPRRRLTVVSKAPAGAQPAAPPKASQADANQKAAEPAQPPAAAPVDPAAANGDEGSPTAA